MGCYDSVIFHCKCGSKVEWQSKAGQCIMQKIDRDSVPVEIANDIQDTVAECPGCNKKYVIKPLFPLTTVMMKVEKV